MPSSDWLIWNHENNNLKKEGYQELFRRMRWMAEKLDIDLETDFIEYENEV